MIPRAGVRLRPRPGTARRRVLGALLAVGCAMASGCAVSGSWIHPEAPRAPAPPTAETLDSVVLVIGDAGLPRLDPPEPVLQALRREAARDPRRTYVVFLGDNVYPRGLPAQPGPERAHAERVLRAQADAVADAGARGFFLPGNHDYGPRDPARRDAQHAFLAALADSQILYLPRGPCPGPEILDAGRRVRLVALDSVYWLADAAVRPAVPERCAVTTDSLLQRALAAACDAPAGRHVLLFGHHPLATHGAHGGFFSWKAHVFPLRAWKGWLWLPLPGVGSIVPWYRRAGGYPQDLAHGRYQRYVRALRNGYAEHPPLLIAGGHDHSLQLLRPSPTSPWFMVSGNGSLARGDEVGRDDDTIYVSSRPGFFRIEFLADGRVRLEAVEVEADGSVQRPFATWLATAP